MSSRIVSLDTRDHMYFTDLSEYAYFHPKQHVRQKNVGWLAGGKEFTRKKSTDALLDLIWEYCALSFEQARGRHACEFCPPQFSPISERNGIRLVLGSAEIRVLSRSGEIFAAPNMIYHYMAVHDYCPPESFVDAVLTGPLPSSPEYLNALAAVELVSTATFRR